MDAKFPVLPAQTLRLSASANHSFIAAWRHSRGAGCSALNVPKNPLIHIDARSVEAEFRATPITKAKAVHVVEKFREKYGAKDVKKYYSEI